MIDSQRVWRTLRLHFLFTYAVFCLNTATYFKHRVLEEPLQALYLTCVWLTYSFLYLVLPMLLLSLWAWSISGRWAARMRLAGAPPWLALGLPSALVFGLLHLYFFADSFVYGLYSFHLHSGFVQNLVRTRGGIESMGSDTQTTVTVVFLALGFIVVEWVLWLAAWKLALARPWSARLVRPRTLLLQLSLLLFLGLCERAAYALSSLKAYTPVLYSARVFPFYLPTTSRRLARWLGIDSVKGTDLQVKVDSIELVYPRAPLRKAPDRPKFNLVWLVSESLRCDMLDAEIMPFTHAFAQRSTRFENHFSSGNGTRMGIFGMFYGLYGPYWFNFLHERRGPVLVDFLLEENYEMKILTSARFTYPEFDQTVWARVPAERLHEAGPGHGWQKDRENVGKMIDFIDSRDASRPFFTFEFFESPHARYYFPPECEIRKPYLETFNYATFDPERDIELVKSRYINSCNHLDTQIERLLEHLERKGLLDSTLVLITGDHGEEFMEHGFWGHNSKFHEEQIRVPLVLWVPGRSPVEISRWTSHLDIPATVLKVLGVENPASDYSLGNDLFGPVVRQWTVVAGWDDLAVLDERFTGVFPLEGLGFGEQIERTASGHFRPSPAEFQAHLQPKILEVLRDLKKFSR